ncbi:hypothetical protein HCN51_48060 [Nonomuraea sp. FMUSA5-5]|uniref:Uncharacterized protein n=1 Tax=Nonomuraea composti TaxID=2720023 RepID=A0ABX1BPK7_9ACTN|nr:hypothetical protein [Nonomuraea sp. FMUSA5-5]NJP97098.1 hypothetical protein [Nonomuraea sp. FMUSA5-5]
MTDLDPLSVAVIAAAQDAAGQKWDRSRRMYALTDPRTYVDTVYPLDPMPPLRPDELVVVPLDPLRPGDIGDVLAEVTWPDTVRGCVLVVEAVLADGRGQSRKAHLAVGVLRDGTYTCLLRLRHEEEILPCPDLGLVDDLVTALLGTF